MLVKEGENVEELKIESYKNLLSKMHQLTDEMDEVILTRYFDSSKYLYSLYFEVFRSIKGFCILIGNGLISQAISILRMALESASSVRVLEQFPNLLEEYTEHSKFRFSIKGEKKQRSLIVKHYKDVINLTERQALDYLDYGWIRSISNKNDFGFHSLIKTAGFDDIYEWVDTFNMWVHGTVVQINVSGNDGDDAINYSHAIIDIAAKILDYVCCDFHNHTKFDFIKDDCNMFTEFREAYLGTNIKSCD